MIRISIDVAEKALQSIIADSRNDCISLGGALRDEYGEEAKEIWANWGVASGHIKEKEVLTVWKSLASSGSGKRATMGTLVYRARQGGFSFTGENGLVRISEEERAKKEEEKSKQRLLQEQKRIEVARKAALTANAIWDGAKTSGRSPYCFRKKIRAEGIRFFDRFGSIVLPMYEVSSNAVGTEIVGAQIIYASGAEINDGEKKGHARCGDKRYISGTAKIGKILCLGDHNNDCAVFYICEGYATAASIRAAVDYRYPVYVAWDASNLPVVVPLLRGIYNSGKLVVVCDDDYLTNNVGIKYGEKAINGLHDSYTYLPKFSIKRAESKEDAQFPRLTDANDLHCHEGIMVLTKQIEDFLLENGLKKECHKENMAAVVYQEKKENWLEDAKEPGKFDAKRRWNLAWMTKNILLISGTNNIWNVPAQQKQSWSAFEKSAGRNAARDWESSSDRREILERDLPALSRGGIARDDVHKGNFDERLNAALERYVALYGTTRVLDRFDRREMSFKDMQFSITPELANAWRDSPLRTVVKPENVVVDPSEKREGFINLFQGWGITPLEDDKKALAVLELVWHLVSDCIESERQNAYDWLLDWLAYPLQNPGKKMSTYVLMHGATNGSGKSLLFDEIISRIYGAHGVVGGQAQFDARFTGWRDGKFYVCFEELASREGQQESAEALKYLVSGRTTHVEKKNADSVERKNLLNVVILSNRVQPIKLDSDDRRAFVIWIDKKIPHEILSELVTRDDLLPGVAEAFFYYLLHRPISKSFRPKAPAMVTNAKQSLITYGMPCHEAFYSDWQAGILDAPYQCCTSMDLYKVYEIYCRTRGFKYALTQIRFIRHLPKNLEKKRVYLYEKSEGLRKSSREVIIVSKGDEEIDVSFECADFQRKAKIIHLTDFLIDSVAGGRDISKG